MKITILIGVLLFVGCSDPLLNLKPNEIITLADEIYRNSNISELNDCTRSKKYINGVRITLKPNQNENSQLKKSKERYYKEILIEENISESDFEYFRSKLQKTKLRHYYKKDNYSIFVIGGAMGDIYGFIVNHDADEIIEDGFRLNDYYYIWIGSKIDNKIYHFSGA